MYCGNNKLSYVYGVQLVIPQNQKKLIENSSVFFNKNFKNNQLFEVNYQSMKLMKTLYKNTRNLTAKKLSYFT